jgi:hypothetical protein
LTAFVASAALAHDDNGRSKTRLSGYEETPLTLSTTGHGTFRARVSSDGIRYVLKYEDLEADATVAHSHLGDRAITGGIIAFLCGGGDKPACPAREGKVEGVIDAADVIGPAAQGIAASELREAIRALRKGFVYANVHTSKYPGGEIRGQIHGKNGDHKNGHHKRR